MSKYENWSSPFFNSLWSDTNETWNEPIEDWRIVGTNPFKRRSKSINDISSSSPGTSSGKIYANICDSFYIIEFGSKRLDLACMDGAHTYDKGNYVILEADRGEDCGIIKGVANRMDFERLLRAHENIISEVHPKRIYRLANAEDLCILEHKRKMEKQALELCREKSLEKDLRMQVVDCEYQWDMNKITFYFDSVDRIDFRELVKELYKIYKTRIWMCSIEKSKNKYLRELIED